MGFIFSILALIGLVLVVCMLFSWEEHRHEKQKHELMIRKDGYHQESDDDSLKKNGYTRVEQIQENIISRIEIFHFFGDKQIIEEDYLVFVLAMSLYDDRGYHNIEECIESNFNDILKHINRLISIGYIQKTYDKKYFQIGYALKSGYGYNDRHPMRMSWEKYLTENNIILQH